MANTTIRMNKIRQILRLHDHGRSKQAIAIQAGVLRNTVKKYLGYFQQSGFTFKEVNMLGDKELEDLFGKSNERKPDNAFKPSSAVCTILTKNSNAPGTPECY